MKIEIMAGTRIEDACAEAVKKANQKNEETTFTFNDTDVVARPGDSAQKLEEKWNSDFESAAKAHRESPEYAARQKRDAEELAQKMSAHMIEIAKTEKEMREANCPWPFTMEQLSEYINSLVERDHDYGTCVYAMSLAALASFYYVSHKLGVTGFQASCADMDFMRRSRSMDGPFMIIKAQDALYPQYNLRERLEEALQEWKPWIKEQAAKKISEAQHAAPQVKAHWEKLAR